MVTGARLGSIFLKFPERVRFLWQDSHFENCWYKGLALGGVMYATDNRNLRGLKNRNYPYIIREPDTKFFIVDLVAECVINPNIL